MFYYHQTKSKNKTDKLLVEAIKEVRKTRGNLGAKKLSCLVLLEGKKVNHKRITRVIKENDLVIRYRRKPRVRNETIERLPVPVGVEKLNDLWSMDFMCSRKINSFRFMLLNIIDVQSRQCTGMRVERSFMAVDVIDELERSIKCYGKPRGIVTDNGAEFTSVGFRLWCKKNQIIHYLTKVARPAENCFVESFNSCVRREVLDANDFSSINKLRLKIEDWREFYNKVRPHGSLNYTSPETYIKFAQN